MTSQEKLACLFDVKGLAADLQEASCRVQRCISLPAPFSVLGGISHHSPIADELLDYYPKMSAKLQSLMQPPQLSTELLNLLAVGLSEERAAPCFARVLERVRTETSYVEQLDELGIAQALATGIDKGKYSATVVFSEKAGRISTFLFSDRSGIGNYRTDYDVCYVEGAPPSTREMLQSLATKGVLPPVVAHLDHELVHHHQTNRAQRVLNWGGRFVEAALFGVALVGSGPGGALVTALGAHWLNKKIMGLVSGDLLLREVHAFEAAASSASTSRADVDERHEIIGAAASTYGNGDLDHAQAECAYDAVHTLRVFGLDDREIGALVKGAKYDPRQNSYPKIAARIAELREQHQLEDDQEFRWVREALFARHELELLCSRRAAQQIAIEELLKLGGIREE